MDQRSTWVIEIFLPTKANDGQPFSRALFDQVRDELFRRFGGVMLFTRSPAEGLWAGEGERPSVDRVITVEVMTDTLDRSWWASYRRTLEERFRQDEVLVRSFGATRL